MSDNNDDTTDTGKCGVIASLTRYVLKTSVAGDLRLDVQASYYSLDRNSSGESVNGKCLAGAPDNETENAAAAAAAAASSNSEGTRGGPSIGRVKVLRRTVGFNFFVFSVSNDWSSGHHERVSHMFTSRLGRNERMHQPLFLPRQYLHGAQDVFGNVAGPIQLERLRNLQIQIQNETDHEVIAYRRFSSPGPFVVIGSEIVTTGGA